MELSTYIDCFNNKLNEFLRDLCNSFPDMSDLKVLKNGLQLAITIDPRMPQNVFNMHVASTYEKKIIEKDEAFFLQENYDTIAVQHGVDLDIIGKLKGIWATLNDENKDIIWKYLHVLVLLNKKCQSLMK